MRKVLIPTFRLGLASGLVLFSLATLLGAIHAPTERLPSLDRLAVLEKNPADGLDNLRLVDLATGAEKVWTLPENEYLDCVDVATWRSDSGETQLVGRWQKFEKHGHQRKMVQAGLALVSFPQGEFLDRVEIDPLPMGPTRWLPGFGSRLIYPAGDGQLYVYDFDRPENSPRCLAWPVGSNAARVQEMIRLDQPGFEGYWLASVSELPKSDPSHTKSLQQSRLWFIRLSEDGQTIVTAKPIAQDQSSPKANDGPYVERWPVMFRGSDGGFKLAYLRSSRNSSKHVACIAPMFINHQTDTIYRGPEQHLFDNHSYRGDAPLIFSNDGNWFLALVGNETRPLRYQKLALH